MAQVSRGDGSDLSLDVLIPTINRVESLILTLTGLAAQTRSDLRVVVADQSDSPANRSLVVQALCRILRARGGSVEWHHRRRLWGIAEQRDFLLRQSRAEAVLYLDDDVFLEPWVVGALHDALLGARCGFVGAFPAGMSHLDDVRPEQMRVEFWDGPVQPEAIRPGDPEWERWHLHRAANAFQAARALPAGEHRLYKVAWVASCVLYDRAKLEAVGGFSFWPKLPRYHSGEEVLVQNLLMRRWGGCAIMPSGAYYAQVPTTVLAPDGRVDGHALELLDDMIARYALEPQTLHWHVSDLYPRDR